MEAADKNAQEMQKDNIFSLHTTTVSETKAKKLPCSRYLGIGHSLKHADSRQQSAISFTNWVT